MRHPRSNRPLVVAVVVGLATLLVSAAAADAQPREPLKMTFVDATPDESAAIYEKLRTIISESDDIDFTDPSAFLDAAERFDVRVPDFASSGRRTGKRELIKRAMRANDLESIVAYKRTGDTLHLIVLGPSGAELEHFRSPVRREEISDEQAVAVLKKIFQVLVPEVREFRDRRADQQTDEEASRAGESTGGGSDSPDDEQIKDRVVDRHKHAHGNLAQKATVSLAPMFGRRALSIATDDGEFQLAHSTPFVGGRGRVDAVLGLMNSETAAFGGTLYGEYAPFSTRLSPDQPARPGTYFRAGGRLRYLAGFSSRLILFGQLGGEVLDVAIESNSTYVGSRYGSLTAGMGAIYHIPKAGDITLHADALPTVATDTNDGAFGDGGFSLGVNPGLRFTLRRFSPWIFSASYDFVLYFPTHSDPELHEAAASGTDSVHVGGLSAGYRF